MIQADCEKNGLTEVVIAFFLPDKLDFLAIQCYCMSDSIIGGLYTFYVAMP